MLHPLAQIVGGRLFFPLHFPISDILQSDKRKFFAGLTDLAEIWHRDTRGPPPAYTFFLGQIMNSGLKYGISNLGFDFLALLTLSDFWPLAKWQKKIFCWMDGFGWNLAQGY
jgi:hypothetical protein